MTIRTSGGARLTPPRPLQDQLRLRGRTGAGEGATTRLSAKKGARTGGRERFCPWLCYKNSQGCSRETRAPIRRGRWLLGGLRPDLPLRWLQFPSPSGSEAVMEEAELPSLPYQRTLSAPPLAGNVWGPHLFAGDAQVCAGSEHWSRGVLTRTSRRVCRPAAVHTYARVHRMCACLASYRSERRRERGRACVWRGGKGCMWSVSGEHRPAPACMSTC